MNVWKADGKVRGPAWARYVSFGHKKCLTLEKGNDIVCKHASIAQLAERAAVNR